MANSGERSPNGESVESPRVDKTKRLVRSNQILKFQSADPPSPFEPGLESFFGSYGTVHVSISESPHGVSDDPPLIEMAIDSCLNELHHANSKKSTIKTYRKAWARFAAVFDRLPSDPDMILGYFKRFDGKTARYRRNNQDCIHLLYKQAVRRGWMAFNPMQGLKRPRVVQQQPNPLRLEEVRKVMKLEHLPKERAVLQLLVGHGWRQNEVLEIKARDVRSISGGMILCHGKHREEPSPILPETADLLRGLAQGLDDDAQVIQGKRGRDERFGSTGMANLVNRAFARAGLSGFTGHNLRDTFATLVA